MDKIDQKHFKDYETGLYDEMFNKDGVVQEHWKQLYENLQKLSIDELVKKQYEIDWQLNENGVTYNIYDDKQTKRKWSLDPIPFVLGIQEWNSLKQGIIQRAKLLDLIFKDIYGEQKLLKEGIVPCEILFNDSHFTREVCGFDENYFNLYYYAADLSRGPDGKFWIISDKTDSPSGLGYAIENRLTTNNISKDLVKDIQIHRIGEFIDSFKESIMEYGDISNPFVVMLSPGPYNETYFEQSYLSSILKCELVRGEDLLVKDSVLYLKNLQGLKQVDIIIRRVDDRYCDPLELQNDSQLGVPGLLDVLRQKNAVMINPIGIGVLENPALNPFMNNICKYFFNEPLIISQIATWWCGQEKEKEYVFKNLNQLIIKSIDKKDPHNIFIGSGLSEIQKAALISKINKNPYIYIAQERIEFSSVPSFDGKKIDSRKNSIRIFCYKQDQEYNVMNGGLVRISSNKDAFIVSNQNGGGSKDLWILTNKEETIKIDSHHDFYTSYNDISLGSLTTKKAENIFWLGRYLQRSIITARMIRLYLKYIMENYRSENVSILEKSLDLYAKAITHLTMTYPGFLGEKVNRTKELNSIIKDSYRIGSLSFTLSMLNNVNINIKNLLSNQSWKVFDKLESSWSEYSTSQELKYTQHVESLDDFLIYLSAYKELIQESISKEQGLVFYKIGSNLEMALLFISKIRSLLTYKHTKHEEYEILQFVLNSYDGLNTYKSTFKTNINLPTVVTFLIFQKNYPKSLFSIVKNMIKLLDIIYDEQNIKSNLDGSQKYIYDIYIKLKTKNTKVLLDESSQEYFYAEFDTFLNEIAALFIQFSNEFTKNYFSHYYE